MSETTDRDQDGVPDAEQLTIEEIEAVDRHFGLGLLEAAKDATNLAPAPGRQSDANFNVDDYDYDFTMRLVVIKHRRTGERLQVNYTKLVKDRQIEIRNTHTISGGVQGGRFDSVASGLLSKLGTFGSFAAAILAAGGGAPALLLNASVELLKRTVKGKKGSALADRLLGGSGSAGAVLLALTLSAGAAVAQVAPPAAPEPLSFDHEFLLSLARTKVPDVRIVHTPTGPEFHSRKPILALGYADAVVRSRFEARVVGRERRVQLIALSLWTRPFGYQNGRHFQDAAAGLLRLVNVETDAQAVKITEHPKGKPPVIHVYPVE